MLLLQDLDGVKNDGLPFKKEEPCLLSTPYCQCCPAKTWVMAKPVDVELAAGFLEGMYWGHKVGHRCSIVVGETALE